MIIMVEGNEGTGKTTLINEISKSFPSIIVKYPKEVKNVFPFLQQLAQLSHNIILDRSMITDLAYRMWDHKPGQMTLEEIGKVLEWKNLKIIYCENDRAFENSIERGEDFITTKELHAQIDSNFRKVFALIEAFSNAKVLHYDYDYNDVDEVIDFLKRYN